MINQKQINIRIIKLRCISAPKSWSHINDTVVLTNLTLQHIQCLHLMYAEIAWVLVSSRTQVQPQIILDPRLPSRLSFCFLWLCWYTSLLSATTDVWMSSLLIALSWLPSQPIWPTLSKPSLMDILFTKVIKFSGFLYYFCNYRDQPRKLDFLYQLILYTCNHWLIQYRYKTTTPQVFCLFSVIKGQMLSNKQ